jgi:alpha-L-rhamnosidase
MDFLDAMHDGHILSFGLGDWCPPGNFEGWDCPVEITSTACWYADARLMTRVAQILDRTQDEQRFDALATRIKTAFNTSFYDVGLGRYQGDEMTAQACALYEGLVEETEEPRVLASLLTMISEADEHLGVGMLGARYLMNALTEHGASEIALRIATQPSYPGWGHWMERGATTLWETWDGSGSRNHIMFGDISAWFMKTLAGIRPDPTSPGFRRVLISPALVSKLTWVEGSYGSPHGPIRSGWRREGREVRVDLHLPPNTTARVTLPLAPDQEITESGRALGDAEGVTQLERLGEDVILGLGSGDFTFRLKPFPAL